MLLAILLPDCQSISSIVQRDVQGKCQQQDAQAESFGFLDSAVIGCSFQCLQVSFRLLHSGTTLSQLFS